MCEWEILEGLKLELKTSSEWRENAEWRKRKDERDSLDGAFGARV